MERTRWLTAWHGTVWEVNVGDRWQPLPRHVAGTWLVLTACNPRGRIFSRTANRHRDAALRRLLPARLRPGGFQRVRGRAADHSWAEPGWTIPLHRRAEADVWLQRFQQLAALVVERHGWSLRWCDGVRSRWPG